MGSYLCDQATEKVWGDQAQGGDSIDRAQAWPLVQCGGSNRGEGLELRSQMVGVSPSAATSGTPLTSRVSGSSSGRWGH